MTEGAVAIEASEAGVRAGVMPSTAVALLLGLFAADNLLLLHFLGLSLPLTAALIAAAALGIGVLSTRSFGHLQPIPYRIVAISLAIALLLFMLGGQGRFFYANVDWQVRDAVLRDMATNPWPFAYDIGGTAYFLRAPIGLYLLPAMFGGYAELALLLWNSLRLALLLSLAWYLFRSSRDRLVALGVFILFSGWDVVGTAVYSALGQRPPWDHIEAWNLGYQYSSNITLSWWVPNHAMAGWTCAVAFLLWRKGVLPIGLFAASIPLVAIWSPLAVMGAVPFALFAGFDALRHRSFDRNDVAITALCVAIALPALFYLQIDAATVGKHIRPAHPLVWGLCALLEVLPFVWPLLREPRSSGVDRPVTLLILMLLLVMPLVQIGVSRDFQMRASIMPLAVLSIYFAQWVCTLWEEKPARTAAFTYALVAIVLGAVTPLLELRRTLANGPSPRPLCSLLGAWHKQDNMIVPYSTYLAPVTALPAGLKDIPMIAGRDDPSICWERKWVAPQ